MKSAVENKIFYTNKTLNLHGRLIDLSAPKIMGILNITTDSFYAGSRSITEHDILARAELMLKDGADLLDLGAYSTRPGAVDVPEEEEKKRLVDAIRLLTKNFPAVLLSADTFRGAVARAAVDAGACMINDVSGGTLDTTMFKTVSELKVPYILMHMRGTPQTMMQQTQYENLVKEVTDYFHQKIAELHPYFLRDIIIDPGFGFAKTATQNFELLSKLEYLKILNRPILVGLSRKSMVWRTLSVTADEALNGTTALNTIALLKGANILRVHDVKEARQVMTLVSTLHPTT